MTAKTSWHSRVVHGSIFCDPTQPNPWTTLWHRHATKLRHWCRMCTCVCQRSRQRRRRRRQWLADQEPAMRRTATAAPLLATSLGRRGACAVAAQRHRPVDDVIVAAGPLLPAGLVLGRQAATAAQRRRRAPPAASLVLDLASLVLDSASASRDQAGSDGGGGAAVRHANVGARSHLRLRVRRRHGGGACGPSALLPAAVLSAILSRDRRGAGAVVRRPGSRSVAGERAQVRRGHRRRRQHGPPTTGTS